MSEPAQDGEIGCLVAVGPPGDLNEAFKMARDIFLGRDRMTGEIQFVEAFQSDTPDDSSAPATFFRFRLLRKA